jgi:hypothetical protein
MTIHSNVNKHALIRLLQIHQPLPSLCVLWRFAACDVLCCMHIRSGCSLDLAITFPIMTSSPHLQAYVSSPKQRAGPPCMTSLVWLLSALSLHTFQFAIFFGLLHALVSSHCMFVKRTGQPCCVGQGFGHAPVKHVFLDFGYILLAEICIQ